MQKFLKGTGIAPSDFIERGWCSEKKKIFTLTDPVAMAEFWKGKPRIKMRDYDQLMFLIGACYEDSGISVSETLNKQNFKPHPSLNALLDWMLTHGGTEEMRAAAQRAHKLYAAWAGKNRDKVVEQQSFLPELLGVEG